MVLCAACLDPVTSSGRPATNAADYPTCWRESPLPADVAARNASAWRCGECDTLWLLAYAPRDSLMEAYRLPASFDALLGVEADLEAFGEPLRELPAGPVRSLAESLARAAALRGGLSRSFALVSGWLAEATAPLAATAFVSLLSRIVGAAVDRVSPRLTDEDAAAARETLKTRFSARNDPAELLQATADALEAERRAKPVQAMPELRDLDLAPIEQCLGAARSPALSTCRASLRALVRLIARQAARAPPTLTVAADSEDFLRARTDPHLRQQALLAMLDGDNAPDIDREAIEELHELLDLGQRLDGKGAATVVAAHRRLALALPRGATSAVPQVRRLVQSATDRSSSVELYLRGL